MKLMYLLELKDKPPWRKPFYSLAKLVKFAKENNYPSRIEVEVNQGARGGIWTAGKLSLFI